MPDAPLSRRGLLTGLAGLAVWSAAGRAQAISAADICGRSGPSPHGLWEKACKRNILFGTALSSDDLDVPAYADLVAKECAVVTPTWEMKWKPLQPREGEFEFAATDRIAAFAQAHNMGLRGHTLVWYENMPDWLRASLGPSNWHDLMVRHMGPVMRRYQGVVTSWDVVNEAVEPNDRRPDGLRDCPWLRAAGPGYIPAAFKLAAHLAPDTRLVYNDYGCEHEGDWTRKRRVAVLRLLENLKKADAPVHALGLQSHLRVGDDFNADTFGRFLTEVRGMGLVPMVTEFDVRADRARSAAEKDKKTAELAKAYLEVVLAAGCDTVVCWGLSDDKNWRGAEEPDDRPLPYDRKLSRKPLYDAIEAALMRSAG